jgi:hypothetical protein
VVATEKIEHHLRAAASGDIDDDAHHFERLRVCHRADDLRHDGVHRARNLKRQIGGLLAAAICQPSKVCAQGAVVRFGDVSKERLAHQLAGVGSQEVCRGDVGLANEPREIERQTRHRRLFIETRIPRVSQRLAGSVVIEVWQGSRPSPRR